MGSSATARELVNVVRFIRIQDFVHDRFSITDYHHSEARTCLGSGEFETSCIREPLLPYKLNYNDGIFSRKLFMTKRTKARPYGTVNEYVTSKLRL